MTDKIISETPTIELRWATEKTGADDIHRLQQKWMVEKNNPKFVRLSNLDNPNEKESYQLLVTPMYIKGEVWRDVPTEEL